MFFTGSGGTASLTGCSGEGYRTLTALLLPSAFALGTTGVCRSSSSSLAPLCRVSMLSVGVRGSGDRAGRVRDGSRECWEEVVEEWFEWIEVVSRMEESDEWSERGTGSGRELLGPATGLLDGKGGERIDEELLENPEPGLNTAVDFG